MVRRVISTIMVFLLSVIKGGAWLGLHLLLAVLEILKITFLISYYLYYRSEQDAKYALCNGD